MDHFKTHWFFSIMKSWVEIFTFPFPFSMKASDSLWFGFLVRALVWFKMQQGHFLKLCAIVQWFWKCGLHMHTHTHFYKPAILNLSSGLPHASPFLHSLLSSLLLHFCSRPALMPVTCRNDKDPSSISHHTHCPISSSNFCICTVPSHRGWIYVFPSSCGSRDCFVFKWGPIDLLLHH